jgi:hypothetical protein
MENEFSKIDAVVRRVLSVWHKELQKREKNTSGNVRSSGRKKRAKDSPAFRAHRACVLSQLGHVSRFGVFPVS